MGRFGETLVDPFENLSVLLVCLKKSSRAPTTEGSPVNFGELESQFSQCLSAEYLGSPRRFLLLRGRGKSSFRDER
jgi:hypothetical protein